jgi:Ca-activated chloride channel homolog
MILLLFAALAALATPQDDAVFRARVALVHVDAEAVAGDGRILGNLRKEDFRVLDNGKEQPVVGFAAEDQPLDLILLFDISGSMRLVVEKVASAAHEALRELQPGDRVSIMVFNTRSRVVQPFTEDLAEVERAMQQDVLGLQFGGGTKIQQAVDDAALRFMGEPKSQRRRAVLAITDNIGLRTRREQTIVRDFWEADALLSGLIIANKAMETIHTVGLVLGPQNLLTQAGMKGIAQKTGGDAIRAEDPGMAFREAMRRIRTRYSLYYVLPEDKPGKRRTIRVELAGDAAKEQPKARVRARTGYIVPAPGR